MCSINGAVEAYRKKNALDKVLILLNWRNYKS